MVEFLTPKRNTFVNKTVGVVSTNTGGAEVGRAIEQAGARATQMFYEEAVKEQKKVGVDTVRKMKSVVTRNDQGELEFEALPDNLSDVARETATPYLLKRYANQLDAQTSRHIGMLSAETKDYNEFNSKVKSYLEATEKQLGSDNVGADLIGMFRDSASKLSAQYGIKKYQAQIKEEEANALEDSLYLVDRFTNDMAMFVREGLDDSANVNKQEALNELELLRGRIPLRTFKAYEARIKVAEKTGIITRSTRGMSSVELNLVERGIRDQTFSGLPKDLKDKLEKLGINNRFFDDMSEANISEVQTDIAARASNQATIETALAKSTADTVSNTLALSGVGTNTTKGRESFNSVFPDYVSPVSWSVNPALINNPVELNKLRISNIMPQTLVDGLKLVETSTTMNPNHVMLLNNYRKQFQYVGGKSKAMPISNQLLAQYEVFDKFLQFYGVDGAEQAYNMAFAESPGDNQARDFEIKRKLGPDSSGSAKSLIANKIMNLAQENDFASESIPLLKTLATGILSNRNVSSDMADEIITNLYSQMFVKSKFTFSHLTGAKVDSRFAPEKYLQGEKLEGFVTGADAKLSLAGSKLKLGDNAFLLPDPKSGDTGALYYAVDETGVLILDKNNQPIQFKTNNILRNVLQSRLKLQEKIDRAIKTQILKENPVLDKESKLPPSFGVDIKKQM
ncbi:hypothetical protein [uncultured Mediterranean phage uvMED]|nr:hypothetical protein [uncultured Mediterranean phage uvMED]